MSLGESAWTLLERALAIYRDSPRADGFLRAHLARLDGPLRLALVGPPASGRSTLLDAIVGERVTPEMDRLVVDWPGEVELIDGGTSDADAVLFLLPQPGGADLRALRAAHDHPIARANPVSTIVVLSRADELGGARVDALISARQVARRHARSADLRGLCVDVVAVAGLLALAGATLTAPEFSVLDQLGTVPKGDLEPFLLSADRFAGSGFPAPLPADVRAALLARFGVFGVRVAVGLVRRGFRGHSALAAELVRTSGIGDLRESIGVCFADRAGVLKARTALIALDIVLRMEPRQAAGPVAADLERIVASAHELREVRLLAGLRTGRVALGDAGEEARYLVGGHGIGPAQRLAMSGDAYQAVLRWRAYAEAPHLGDAERRAVAVVVRSCEELVAAP
ncbi:MAG: hypothetical protein M3548_00100 [Actinomycetota bacterium]|nr:hypothetical protein [Actinomycetota bacterium]